MNTASKINISRETADFICNLMLNKKAEDILLLDIREVSSIADYFVICSGGSDTHVKAITQEVMKSMKKAKIKLLHEEGYSYATWVLLDYIDVVVHVFQDEVREYYKLEELWGDAPREIIEDEKKN